MMGVWPESIISALAGLTSTPTTLWPMEAKQAAETEPTYPKPKMLTDKPKRILLAIEYLGLTHYINPLKMRRQAVSHQFANVPARLQQHAYWRHVTEISRWKPTSAFRDSCAIRPSYDQCRPDELGQSMPAFSPR